MTNYYYKDIYEDIPFHILCAEIDGLTYMMYHPTERYRMKYGTDNTPTISLIFVVQIIAFVNYNAHLCPNMLVVSHLVVKFTKKLYCFLFKTEFCYWEFIKCVYSLSTYLLLQFILHAFILITKCFRKC